MVNIYDAYKIINKSILRVADDVVPLDILELEDRSCQVRLDEAPFSLTERRDRVDGVVVVGHNLNEYVNRFYSISLDSNVELLFDFLINAGNQQIDLTEFGEFL